MTHFTIREIQTVDDLPDHHSNFKKANPNNRGELANTPGGDTIIVVYDTEQGDKPYLYNRIKFDNQYINVMRDDNIVIVYKIISYPDDDINM